MMMPPVIRVFFAVDLPAHTRQAVESCLVEMRKKAKTNAIRWSKIENLHITLHFIGQMQSEHVSRLVDNVKNALSGKSKPIILNVGEVSLFPTPYRPRVIVFTLKEQEELAAIAEKVGQGIIQSEYEIEKRPFRGHLTLGRIKQPRGVKFNFLSEVALPEFEPIVVEDIVLFRSEPQPEGSRYTVIDRIQLI